MLTYFKNRHTCRTFTDTDISDAKIKELLELAAHAPTTGNMQLYSVVITRDTAQKALLAPAHFSQPAFMNAPVVLTFCADLNRFVKWCEARNAVPGFDNFQSLMSALLDTVILAQQFVTVAEMHGIGTCYLGTTTYNPDKIAEILHLPHRVVPITTLAIGYSAGNYEDTDRLDVDAFVHSEKYRDYSDDDINRIYSEKEKREDSHRFITENNKSTLAQVFTDVRYPAKNNEHFSKVLLDFIHRQGF